MAWRGQTRNDESERSGGTGRRLHEKTLGALGAGLDVDRGLVLDPGRSALVELWSDQGAVDHEEVATEARAELVAHLLVRVEQPCVDRRILMDGDGIVRS